MEELYINMMGLGQSTLTYINMDGIIQISHGRLTIGLAFDFDLTEEASGPP